MGWIDIETSADVQNLMQRVECFHDWYLAGLSYDPLARAESKNPACWITDSDSLIIRFRYDSTNKDGAWPEFCMEFNGVYTVTFANFKEPDPFDDCMLLKTNQGWLFTEGGLLNQDELSHPENIRANIVVFCEKVRWNPLDSGL